MKLSNYILASMVIAAGMTGLSSCDTDFDCPPVVVPEGGLGGDGSADAPLLTNGVRAYYTAYYSDAPDTDTYYWATGYIVGCVVTTETVYVANDATSEFTAPFGTINNLLIASTPDETDYNKCFSVQLPSGAVRNALNLSENPGNVSRLVTLYGYIDKYLGLPGLKQVEAFNWGAEGLPDYVHKPAPKPESIFFRQASALTSGKGYGIVVKNGTSYSMAKPAKEGSNYGWLYVTGVTTSNNVIKGDEANAFMFTSAAGENEYYIVDSYGRYLYMEGTYNSFQLSTTLNESNNNYKWLANINDDGTWTIINAGNSKVMQYYIEKSSFGAYPTIEDGYLLPMLYEMDGDMTIPEPGDPGTDPTPDPGTDPTPGEAGVIYTALGKSDATLTQGWTFNDISLSGDLTYVWSWKEYNGNHYLNASAYLGGDLAAESYAISGVISLAGAKDCSVSFDHAAKYQKTLRQGCGIMAREAGTTDWTMLTIGTWPEAGSWTFVNSGEISLAQFDGKEIELAFKYLSTTAGADTWEIQNLIVKGTK